MRLLLEDGDVQELVEVGGFGATPWHVGFPSYQAEVLLHKVRDWPLALNDILLLLDEVVSRLARRRLGLPVVISRGLSVGGGDPLPMWIFGGREAELQEGCPSSEDHLNLIIGSSELSFVIKVDVFGVVQQAGEDSVESRSEQVLGDEGAEEGFVVVNGVLGILRVEGVVGVLRVLVFSDPL